MLLCGLFWCSDECWIIVTWCEIIWQLLCNIDALLYVLTIALSYQIVFCSWVQFIQFVHNYCFFRRYYNLWYIKYFTWTFWLIQAKLSHWLRDREICATYYSQKWVKIQNKGTGQNFKVASLQESFVKLWIHSMGLC